MIKKISIKKLSQITLISLVFMYGSMLAFQCHQQEKSSLSDLIEEFKHYTTTNITFHAGDLYEHSLWVAITINEWFKTNSHWANGLNQHDRRIAVLVGLLHDVGKAGDLEFSFYTKPRHERDGQSYLLGEKTFLLTSRGTFNFEKLFQSLSIDDNDKRLIALLVAAHSNFGWSMNDFEKKHISAPDCLYNYMNKLKDYASKSGYRNKIDKRIMRLVLLISAADVRGAQRYKCNHSFSIGGFSVIVSPPITHPEASDKFQEFNYETSGIALRNAFIRLLNNYSSLESTSDSFAGTINVPCLT